MPSSTFSADQLSQLALGQLDVSEREALVDRILADPLRATEAKLALRLRDEAGAFASAVVVRSGAQRESSGLWTLRLLAAGSALGVTMLVLSPLMRTPTQPTQSVAAVAMQDELIMASSGFEPDTVFGGSFE